MNLPEWLRLISWLAVEAAAAFALAALLQTWIRSPRAARTLWRTALASVLFVWIAELSDLRDALSRPVTNPHHYIVTTRVGRSQEQQSRDTEKFMEKETPPEPVPVKWPAWVWLAGSALLLGRSLLARVWLGVRRCAAAPADEDSWRLTERLRMSLGLNRVEAQGWENLSGPVAFGIFRPAIALPPDFSARFSETEREAMLAHEMAHLAARDPFWLMVSDVAAALAWWQPMVWWARCRLQSANEAAADEASTLMPGGAHILAECLVRLGRELTGNGPARALGISGRGRPSHLAARIEGLLRGPRTWRPLSAWARWAPQVSAAMVALASASLPIQTGLSGSILAVMAGTAQPVRAEMPPTPVQAPVVASQTPIAMPEPPKAETPSPAVPPAPTEQEAKSEKSSEPWIMAPVIKLAKVPSVSLPTKPPPKAFSPGEQTNYLPKVVLLIDVVALPDQGAGDLGLDWLFGRAPTSDATIEISRDWADLDTTNVTHPQNVLIDRLRTEGQSAVLKEEQFTALRKQILARTPADLLSRPKIETGSGLEATVSVLDAMTCVTGVEVTRSTDGFHDGVNYLTDPFLLGVHVDILPKLEGNGLWRLRVRSDITSFIGYDKMAHDTIRVRPEMGAKSASGVVPHPRFRAVEADAEESLPLGQTLVLRGPLWTETTETKSHLLFARKKKTTTQQRLYVFVTPQRPADSKPAK